MCKCTPEIRTPYCGRGNCISPHDKPQGARSQLPQDVEEFIDEHELVSSSGSEVNSLIRTSDLRAWMTGHVRVPVEPVITAEMKAECMGEFSVPFPIQCFACEGDEDEVGDCEECHGAGEMTLQISVPWTTMKDIYTRMYKSGLSATKERT